MNGSHQIHYTLARTWLNTASKKIADHFPSTLVGGASDVGEGLKRCSQLVISVAQKQAIKWARHQVFAERTYTIINPNCVACTADFCVLRGCIPAAGA
jgi:hypothetical protein